MFREPFSLVARDGNLANNRKEVVLRQLHPKRSTSVLLDTSESGDWPQSTMPRRVPSYDWPTAFDSTQVAENLDENGHVRCQSLDFGQIRNDAPSRAKEVSKRNAAAGYTCHDSYSVPPVPKRHCKPSALFVWKFLGLLQPTPWRGFLAYCRPQKGRSQHLEHSLPCFDRLRSVFLPSLKVGTLLDDLERPLPDRILHGTLFELQRGQSQPDLHAIIHVLQIIGALSQNVSCRLLNRGSSVDCVLE